MEKDEWCRRFVEYQCTHAGFETFDNGTKVVDYARETAENSWDCRSPDETPEHSAEGDMDYWGEE